MNVHWPSYHSKLKPETAIKHKKNCEKYSPRAKKEFATKTKIIFKIQTNQKFQAQSDNLQSH